MSRCVTDLIGYVGVTTLGVARLGQTDHPLTLRAEAQDNVKMGLAAPAELAVQCKRPVSAEATKALSLSIPPLLLARADEVID
jgi:hypothetical protein